MSWQLCILSNQPRALLLELSNRLKTTNSRNQGCQAKAWFSKGRDFLPCMSVKRSCIAERAESREEIERERERDRERQREREREKERKKERKKEGKKERKQ